MSEPDEFTDRIDSPPVKPLSDDGLDDLRLLLFAKPRGTIGLRPVVCLLMRLDAVQAELEQARSLRLAKPSEAVDPAVHTPERIAAYLTARGWSPCDRLGPHWISDEHPDAVLHVHRVATAVDYPKRVGLLVSDLAEMDGAGELQVLADIEAATP
jgi:hypothetical protein